VNIKRVLLRGPIVAVRGLRAVVCGIPFRFLELMGQMLPESAWGCRLRGALYKPFLKRCGRDFQVALHAKLEHLRGIEVGDHVYIGHGCWISGLRGGVALEDEVMLGPMVTIISSNHTFREGSARFARGRGGPIRIGRGTWIAAGVTVIAGVTVGPSCLLAAGAVVTKDVPAGAIAGGVPAKVIGETSSLAEEPDVVDTEP
jgi:maltose O-acetyltransferase